MSLHPMIKRHNTRFARDGVFETPKGQIVMRNIGQKSVYFFVANPDDYIQKSHLQGKFYEEEELELIRAHFPLGGKFCDIGANIGNHSLFVAHFCNASLIVPFELNPVAMRLYETNIFLNGLKPICDRRFMGLGLSDRSTDTAKLATRDRNLGWTRVTEGEGDIPLRIGDELLDGYDFDMIKIDVEGHEIHVLKGLKTLIGKTKPKIFIEVDTANEESFWEFVSELNYTEIARLKRYKANTNFLLGPAD